MLITDIAAYIQLHGRVSLSDLSRHFKIQDSAMQQMLTFWLKKDKIKLITLDDANCSADQNATNNKCSDCTQSQDSFSHIYAWNSIN